MDHSILLHRAPTPFFFCTADEDRFLATGIANCTGTEVPSAALRRRFGVPVYVVPRGTNRIPPSANQELVAVAK
ncbi:hypothetical protein HZA87_04395 [Candidatus Uhrbacteria bacterium]|nr:hypothetical protein [Candidatus Uhrbacteria bacterium]